MYENVLKAIEDLKNGKFILIYDFDNRERETDFVIPSQFVSPRHIATMRKDGGGLVCTTLPYEFWSYVNLPYLVDIFEKVSEEYPILKHLKANDIPYDAKSAFSLTINHRKTYTGITDNDRALTIREFSKVINMAKEKEPFSVMESIKNNFRSPGHVHLLNASLKGLNSRRGHTELSTYMVRLANLIPSATICEMMDDEGGSLPKQKAMEYAKSHGITYVTGDEIIDFFEHNSNKQN